MDGLSLGKVNIKKSGYIQTYTYIYIYRERERERERECLAALSIFMFGIFHNKLLGKEYSQINLNSSPAFGRYQLCGLRHIM